MRSYYAHLASTQSPTESAISPRPTFRSSAIFPVIHQQGIKSRVLFMGYWILKRNIAEIACVVSLRKSDNSLIARHNFLIKEAKTFRIEASDLLAHAGHNLNDDFIGSIEVEFFSTQNLFFPFPAVVINYYGPSFSTVVHTAQRVYNDYDDMTKNNQTKVPESGFNIYADDESEPFISLINGNLPVDNSPLEMQVINHKQEVLDCHMELGRLAPYETKLLYPARHFNIKDFLSGKVGVGKIRFNVNGIFPRLVVGNFHPKIPALTITHTYYDCSQACSESDYWRPEEKGWHSAALMLPAAIADHYFTNIYFYPIYSPSTFAIDLEIYDTSGKLLGSKSEVVVIQSPRMHLYQIPTKTICQQLGLNTNQNYAVRLMARPLEGNRIPARIKLGLDVGVENAPTTPCNICTNLQPFNPAMDAKPTAFRWAPILTDQPSASIWLMNSSPATNYQRSAELSLTFFRENDDLTIKRTITLPPHGFTILRPNSDKILKEFLKGTIGWMTLTTSNPYTTTYYFAENNSGIIGGDHGF